MAQDYRELVMWQKAFELTVLTYRVTRSFPNNEMYGLISQMRRASVSICELLTQIQVAKALGFGDSHKLDDAESLSNEVSKMLLAFIQTLTASA